MSRVLDTFCGAGGVSRGLILAQHRVVLGVDINPALRADYLASGAERFQVGDALECLEALVRLARSGRPLPFDCIWASPPCQAYSQMSKCRPEISGRYPALIGPVRELLDETRLPYVIENVEGARDTMNNPVTLCGWMFSRETYRHRLFESGGGLVLAQPPQPPADMPGRRKTCGWPHPTPTTRAGHWEPGKFVSVSGHERREPVRRVMEIDWMTRREDVAEAIPPYMAQWVGKQL